MKLVAAIVRKFRSLFKQRERFLVIEIIGTFLRMSSFLVDFSEKEIRLVKSISAIRSESTGTFPFEELKLLGKGFGKISRYKVIFSLGSKLATTVHSGVTLMRDKFKEPIDESDLDNRIAQGIWKIFDRQRGRAAQKMGVHDIEVLLSDVRVKGVKLDGHRVVNPVGFKAKTIEIQFSQTFNTRRFVDDARRFVPTSNLVLMAEGGTIATDILLKGEEKQSFLFVSLAEQETECFAGSGSGASWVANVSWGRKNLLRAIQDEFAVSEVVAEKIFNLYLIRQASPPMLRRIEKFLSEACAPLSERLKESLQEYDADTVYLFSFFNLPELLFLAPVLKKLLKERVRVVPVGEDFLNEKLGFDIRIFPKGSATLIHSVAAILEFYFLPHDDKMNRIAKRHARWLIT